MITNVIFQSILIVDTDKHKARHVSFLPGSNAYTYRRTRGNAPFPSASPHRSSDSIPLENSTGRTNVADHVKPWASYTGKIMALAMR